ncbi:hypothetical protein, partial [Stenotrophomonas maltophilia]|uniref:hypothetical protein n=1 Tax=Stenotrophomonas maltophilia TaxID=40324 RepID=UPI00195534D2
NLGKVALYQLSYSRLGGEILPIPRMASSAFFRTCETPNTALSTHGVDLPRHPRKLMDPHHPWTQHFQ